MKKIVITGGLGYIGTELCKHYSGEARFKNIVVLDTRFVSERVKQLREWGINFIQASILNETVLENELKDADVIFHLAGITDVAYVKSEENNVRDEEIRRVGVEGTRNVIKYAHEDAKIIFPSTHVVYEGFAETKLNIGEEVLPCPVLAYASGKAQSETDLMESSSNFVVLRLGSVYGYSSDTMRIGIMPNLFSKITSQNGIIKLFSGGIQLKSLVAVEDVVRCMKYMGENDINREIFHLSNENMTVKEVAELCKVVHPELTIIETDDEIPNLGYTISNKKLLSTTDFEFRYNIKTSLNGMINNWSARKMPEDLEYIIRGEKEFIDERGKISNYELTEPINMIGYIESKAGTVRANHYHPIQEQKCLLITGKYISVIKDLADPNAVIETRIINAGDLSVIRPNVAHTMVFLEDSIFLNLVRGEREHENYGMTHTFPYKLVDEGFKNQLINGIKTECRCCGNKQLKKVLSLGKSPLANNLLNNENEQYEDFPLEIDYCPECHNTQLNYVVPSGEMFDNYLYVSSTSSTFRKHFEDATTKYIEMFNLNESSIVVDIGSNDGIGLKPFKEKGIEKAIGIEPAKNVAEIARRNGISTLNTYFDENTLFELNGTVDLVTASNVFAHADDLKSMANNAFRILKDDGVFIVEVQYFLDMIEKLTFDNIYHEHVNYWTVVSISNFFRNLGYVVVDVEHIETHGGSIRVYVKKEGSPSERFNTITYTETMLGIKNHTTYKEFGGKIKRTKENILNNIQKLKDEGYSLIGYGSPAKATTALNYYGITNKHIDYIIEDNELKHNKFVPGTKIPIRPKPITIPTEKTKVLILAWNFAKEITEANKDWVEAGIEFVSIKNLT